MSIQLVIFLFSCLNFKIVKLATEQPLLSFLLLNYWKEPMSSLRWTFIQPILLQDSKWLQDKLADIFKINLLSQSKVSEMRLFLIAPKLQCLLNLLMRILNSLPIWLSNQLELLSNNQFSELNIQSNPLTFLRPMVKVQLKVNSLKVTPFKLSRLISKCQQKLKTLKLLALILTLTNSDFNSVFKFLLMIQKISKKSDKKNVMF